MDRDGIFCPNITCRLLNDQYCRSWYEFAMLVLRPGRNGNGELTLCGKIRGDYMAEHKVWLQNKNISGLDDITSRDFGGYRLNEVLGQFCLDDIFIVHRHLEIYTFVWVKRQGEGGG